MLTHWQEPIFKYVAQKLPFVKSQPLSTFSMACILGDATYILNGKVGSLFNLGLGAIHPGMILTLGGISAMIGHVFLLASSDKIDQPTDERGAVTTILAQCRQIARWISFGWQPRNPFMLGFAALTVNGLALSVDALWEVMFFGVTPIALIQGGNGLVVMLGLGAAMISRVVVAQKQRDWLNAFAPKLLAYGTIMTLVLGGLAVAPFMVLGGLCFVLGNAAQYHYALRMKRAEHETVLTAEA